MSIPAVIALAASLVICVYAAVSDLRTERVPNRALIVACGFAVVIDLFQYVLCVPNLFPAFLMNVSTTCVLSLVLFFTHTWAGGDCKLACALALLYPAEAYLTLGATNITLPLAIGIAFVLGSVCLFASFFFDLMRKRLKPDFRSIGKSFLTFAQSYVCALSCIGILHLVDVLTIAPHLELSPIVMAGAGFCCVWLLSSAGLLKNRILLAITLAVNIVAAALLQIAPLGANPFRYVFVLSIVLLRIIVSQQNYQTIPTADVTQGMVLATSTSLLFLNSRVKGLPGVSTEDLRSRLTEEEAASVRRWGVSAKGRESVEIVRKMPFAIFVSLGFIAYFALGGIT